MKPAPFDYAAASSLEAAVDALARSGGEGKLLADGQSLVPALNMRLASPALLVDLNRIPELAYIHERDGGLAIGAMTRHCAVEVDPFVAARIPLLAEAVRCISHPPIRTRGTPGVVISTLALLRETPRPTDAEIRAGLSGNLCRCTGYQNIVRAVRLAADHMAAGERTDGPAHASGPAGIVQP